jgi:catechol 2,3-dioxygenase-like lactoylglutathione lyase family enzyme
VSIALERAEQQASDQVKQPWTIRSILLAVADLDRSVAFYRELGPFDELAREDAVAVLGHVSPASILLILRESRGSHHVRHGQQSLGLRSMTFNVGSLGELDRIEAVLRGGNQFSSRQQIADGASELLRGRDPDNLPLVFVCYSRESLGPDYFRTIVDTVYSVDT